MMTNLVRANLSLLVASALSLAASSARAEPPLRAAPPSDEEVTRRIAFLQTRLDRGTPAANRWWYGWYTGWSALTVGQGVIAVAVTDPGLRADAAVGAVGSSLGLIPLGLAPFPARHAAADLRAMPESTPEERRKKLARGERLLRESAESEVLRRKWFNHVLCGTVSTGVGLVLALGYGRPVTGALSATIGIALSEAQIFTMPTAAIDDWKEYQSGGGTGSVGQPRRPAPGVSWFVAPLAGGAVVGGSF
ncbi:hypothetical protein [Polyangium jinanense]|uniref:Secreted protein n=1 Tax=Polyangium jinanense TaxID=2829994 RepID=A0A9X4ASW0_9BACT|nr:hypothetical protein [Polyangium jinanense]MDC3955306.1 hypothetical protein [Polyangium jinanense]MDC3981607.1 hypothetical protein [Polyangium jinanense]